LYFRADPPVVFAVPPGPGARHAITSTARR
jgi:hypothetical protein